MDPRSVLLDVAEAASHQDLDGIRTRTGNERLVESLRRLLGAFPDATIDVEWTVAEGARGVGWAHIRGTHRGAWRGLAPTGRPIDVHGMLALQVDELGRVEDFWLANDWLSIATQIGVPLTLPDGDAESRLSGS